MSRHYPDLGSASDWSCRVGNLIQPIRSTTPDLGIDASSLWYQFLRSFLRRHLAGKPVVASPNVDFFLRLLEGRSISRYVDCRTLCSVLRMDTRFHLVPKVLSYSNHRQYHKSAFTFDTFGYVSLTCLDFFQIYDLLFLPWTEL